MLDNLGGNGGFIQIRGIGSDNLHGDGLGKILKDIVVGGFGLKSHQNADSASAVNIAIGVALVTGKAADFHVLTNGEDFILKLGGNGPLAVHAFARQQGLHVRGICRDNGLGADGHKVHKFLIFGHKVSLGVDLNDSSDLLLLVVNGVDNALGGDSAGLLGGCSKSLLTQELNRLFHIALRSRQSLLAVHHAASGSLAEGGYVLCSKCCHIHYLLYFHRPRRSVRPGPPSSQRAGGILCS